MKNKDIIIETERLILRKFNHQDREAIFEFNSNEEVMRYTGNSILTSLDQTTEILKTTERDYQTYGYGRLALVYKEENKVIGFAGLKYLPEFGETDIGYRMLPTYWGRGIATEAASELLKYGFEQLGLKRIIGIAYPENIASWNVLEKIGMTFYKMDDYDGDGGNYRWYEAVR